MANGYYYYGTGYHYHILLLWLHSYWDLRLELAAPLAMQLVWCMMYDATITWCWCQRPSQLFQIPKNLLLPSSHQSYCFHDSNKKAIATTPSSHQSYCFHSYFSSYCYCLLTSFTASFHIIVLFATTTTLVLLLLLLLLPPLLLMRMSASPLPSLPLQL